MNLSVPCLFKIDPADMSSVGMFFVDQSHASFRDTVNVHLSGILIPRNSALKVISLRYNGVLCASRVIWQETPQFDHICTETKGTPRGRFKLLFSLSADEDLGDTGLDFFAELDDGSVLKARINLKLAPNDVRIHNEYLTSMRFRFASAKQLPTVKSYTSANENTDVTVHETDQALVCSFGLIDTLKMKIITETTPFGHNSHWNNGAFIPDNAHALLKLYTQFSYHISSSFHSDGKSLYYLANYWDMNYQHFLIETLPKIIFAIEHGDDDSIFFLRDFSHIRQAADVLGITQRCHFVGEQEILLVTGGVKFFTPISSNFNKLPQLTFSSLSTFASAVKNAQEGHLSSREPSSPFLFLGRRSGDPRNQGKGRNAINQHEIDDLLSDLDFDQQVLEDLTYTEKSTVLSGRKCILTPIGANLMNIAISENIDTVIIIRHRIFAPDAENWFKTLIEQTVSNIGHVVVFEDVDMKGDDIHCPYQVDIEKLRETILRFL